MRSITEFVVLAFVLLSGCAKVVAPTGGEKDQIPPKLVSVTPRPYSNNFKGNSVRFTFNEEIEVKSLKQELSINPGNNILFKSKVKKNVLTLTFIDSLLENTTYLIDLGFSVVDLTEGNVSPSPATIFSTGSTLDTMKLSGLVSDRNSGEPIENALILVYPFGIDSMDVDQRDAQPLFRTRTNKKGEYFLYNLRNDNYRIYALVDQDKNGRYSKEEEAIAFTEGNYQVFSDSTLNLQVQTYATSMPKVEKPSSKGQLLTIPFNKEVTVDSLYVIAAAQPFPFSIKYRPKELVLFYPDTLNYDTMSLGIQITDAYDQTARDTLKISVNPERKESDRRRSKSVYPTAKFSLNAPDRISLERKEKQGFVLETTLPILEINRDSILFLLQNGDTAITQEVFPPDSSLTKVDEYTIQFPEIVSSALSEIVIKAGALLSVNGDSSALKTIKIAKLDPTKFGAIEGLVLYTNPNFKVQLLDKNFEVEQEMQGDEMTNFKRRYIFRFNYVRPGKKFIRILVDKNGDGKYEEGNFLTRKAPEPSYILEKPITLKANWEILRKDLKVNLIKLEGSE